MDVLDNHYTIVLPTRGSGQAFDIFIEKLLPRYNKFLNKGDIEEFIVICPLINLSSCVERILEKNEKLPFVFYSDEDICGSVVGQGWMKQQVIKLATSQKVKTKYYFIIDDDLVLTKPLSYSDFFHEGKIKYSYESWTDNGPKFSTNQIWWSKSALMHKYNVQDLKKYPDLMGVTPELMITDIVKNMLIDFGPSWPDTMIKLGATEFSLYWIYIIKTNNKNLYFPCNQFFTMDHEVNILRPGLNFEQLYQKVQKGIKEKNYWFLVIQSWLLYPKDWIIKSLTE